jgi:4-hydroxy-4-methyl-2-oxoglutarate aldolase
VTLADVLAGLGTATLGESGAEPMHPRVRAAWSGAHLAAPAFTVQCPPGDNLAIHVAVVAAPPGSALVVQVDGLPERGYWGEVLATAAEARGLAGLVIDGGVRDVDALARHGFPVFCNCIALRGTIKDTGGTVGGPVRVGDAAVHAGDWVVADADGVAVISADALDDVLERARARAERERGLFTRLREGATTIDLLGLDPTRVIRGQS